MTTRIVLALAAVFAMQQAVAQAGAGLHDANLVPADSLADHALIDTALADTIVESRPYLTAMELDRALSGVLSQEDRQALYASLFRQINLNTASREEIMLIPGMSERMAHEFEEYRPYASLEQFRREIGKYVDENEVARLEQYVFIPLALNTASEDELMTIPGMTPKMAHEFEEYRPYASMEQFRREIGKYVDDDEVARLESYVTLD